MSNNTGYFDTRAMIAFVCALIGLAAVPSYGRDSFHADYGVFDARKWNFNEDRIALNGHWIFYDQLLLTPNQCKYTSGKSTLVPGIWNDLRTDRNGVGFGTYHLKVLVPASLEDLTLEIPQLYNSYQLWINGAPIAANGKVGAVKEETIPQWLPQTVAFKNQGDTLYIVLQVANFHHHKGGIRESFYLGKPAVIAQHYTAAKGSNFIEVGVLMIEALIFLVFYSMQRKKKIALYFSLLCFTWAARVLFSKLYLFILYFPDFNWNAAVRIEYITLYFIMIWSTLFLNLLFQEASSQLFKYILITVNTFFILFTLFTPPMIFTRWLPLYLITCAITLLYSIVVVVRALIMEKSGVWFLVSSLFLGIAIMGYDIVAFEGLLANNTTVTSIGYTVIFILITIALLTHLGILKSKFTSGSTLTYQDLYRKD